MVGDAEVLEAEFHGGVRHFFEGIFAVARGGMAVEGAADVFELDDIRQRAVFRGFDLSIIFAEGGVDVGEAEGFVEFCFVVDFGWVRGVVVDGGESVFVERVAELAGAGAEGDVVFFAPGEVGESEGEFVVRDHAEVALGALFGADTGFGIAVAEDFVGPLAIDEEIHDGFGIVAGDDEVDIVDRFLGAAIAAGEGGA